MPWGRCDDTHYDHPKVSALPVRIRNEAIGLYWRSISYSNRHLTNGRIPVSVLVSVLDGTPAIAEELRKVRLFERAGASAFRVHDFDDFNETRQEVLAKREKKAAAGKTGGLRSGAVRRAKRNGSTNEAGASQLVEPPSRPSSETTSPQIPDPTERAGARDGLPHVDVETAQLGEQLTGHTFLQAGFKQQTELDRLIEDHGPAPVRAAMSAVANGSQTSWRQLVWGAMKRLEPIADAKPLSAREERAETVERLEAKYGGR